jgi:hypothetical protein
MKPEHSRMEYVRLTMEEYQALIDSEPVKHAKWHNKNNKHWVCSECGGLAETAHYCSRCYYDYCPNCGAKMDKEEI